jgi:hypothetical protein
MSADEAFIRDNADIISLIPGEAPSLNDSTTSVVDGDAEPPVMDLGSNFAAVLDDLRGGGGAEFFKKKRYSKSCAALFTDHEEGNRECQTRPDERWKLSTDLELRRKKRLCAADTGTHFGIFRGLSESAVVAGAGANGGDDDAVTMLSTLR